MPTFVEAMTGFMKSNFCAALDVLGDAITLGSELVPGPGPFLNVPNALGALVCDKPPDNLEPPPPPFTGGQCAGVLYNVSMTGQVPPNAPQNFEANIVGPLRYNQDLPPVPENPGCSPGSSWQRFSLAGSSGPTVTWVGCDATFTVNSVTPLGGAIDNCGDPPPSYPPPGDSYEFGGDVTYNIDGDTTVTVPVTAVFAPIFVDVDGSLRIPVNVDVGGVQLTGNLEVSPSFTLNLKPGGIKTGPGKPDDPELGPGQPGVPVPEDEEDVDVIVGVLVFSTLQSDAQNATGFPSVGGPTFLVPRLGSVQFAIKTGNSIGWTSDLDVKNLECYVPCPAPQGAIAVRVTPIAGVTRTFTPVRGKPLTSF